MSKDDFYAGLLSLFTQSGQVWGLPAAAQPKGTGYNTQLFDEAGVDYPTRAWTTADFLRLTQLLTHGDGAAKQCRQPVGRGCAFFPSSRRRVMAFPPAVRSCSQPRTANR